MSEPSGRLDTLRRRAVSVPVLVFAAVTLTLVAPIWLPFALLVDLVRLEFRFPIARLLAFAVCWCWIELGGVVRAFGLWLQGRSGDVQAHYDLMAWWSASLFAALGATIGMRPRWEGAEALAVGNAVVFARHASLGDSLLSGWVLANRARLHPRYVLKKELLYDPCLDVVGSRVPNHFLDRTANDGSTELPALRLLAAGMGPRDICVIFPEGSRTNAAKRERALARIAEHDPARAARMSSLRRLLPPRWAGSTALVEGAPDADIVLAWHTGFDGLDSFRGMIREVGRPMTPVRFVTRRIQRADVPDGDAFGPWLDEQWLRLDAEVDAALTDT
ncbi:MAG: 1-acyl-sn-glycerol-3-phosphate acyltransferase [Ilumatobacteraceae bacterium]